VATATATGGESPPLPLWAAVEEAEVAAIRRALAVTGNNKSRACKLLDIHRATLYQKLARYGIEAAGG
ncbi:MAG: helix-turn-helix domain-containing protein, partial [Deferrisomatales bacterium]